METIVLLGLKEPEKFDAPVSYLETGLALKTARCQKDLLHKLLGSNNLETNTDIHVGIRVGKVPPHLPLDWRQTVNNSRVDMTRIGILENSFVVWVEVDKYSWGDAHCPYIHLATLKPGKIAKLQSNGDDEKIFNMLGLEAYLMLDPTTGTREPEDRPEEPEEDIFQDPDELAEELAKLLAE